MKHALMIAACSVGLGWSTEASAREHEQVLGADHLERLIDHDLMRSVQHLWQGPYEFEMWMYRDEVSFTHVSQFKRSTLARLMKTREALR